MDRHLIAECGDLLGKTVTELDAKPLGPFVQRIKGRLMEARDLIFCQLSGQPEWREPRTMQDFIRVGVANPAEKPWIGQGPLECPVFLEKGVGEGPCVGLENLEPAAIKLCERVISADEMHRGAFL